MVPVVTAVVLIVDYSSSISGISINSTAEFPSFLPHWHVNTEHIKSKIAHCNAYRYCEPLCSLLVLLHQVSYCCTSISDDVILHDKPGILVLTVKLHA